MSMWRFSRSVLRAAAAGCASASTSESPCARAAIACRLAPPCALQWVRCASPSTAEVAARRDAEADDPRRLTRLAYVEPLKRRIGDGGVIHYAEPLRACEEAGAAQTGATALAELDEAGVVHLFCDKKQHSRDNNVPGFSHLPRIIRNPTGHIIFSKKDTGPLLNCNRLLRYGAHEYKASGTLSEQQACEGLQHFVMTKIGIPMLCHACKISRLKYSRGLHKDTGPFIYEACDPPESIDWVKRGVVTPVQAQLINGPCWIFGSVASTESINALVTGKLIKLSEQQLLDCCSIGSLDEGGFPQDAFEYIINNGGIVSAKSYPYIGRRCACKKFEDDLVTIDEYQFVPPDEQSLKKAVANLPVVVDIASGGKYGWMANYVGGIADCHVETSYHDLDHSMIAVAYGATKKGKKFWYCKNSLGPTWGRKGFCLIARDVGYKGGAFGIAKSACFPIKRSVNRYGCIEDEAALDQEMD